MSSYLSNLLTTTTSRYNSLRRTLLSDEADGDTEDDTHICRVMRAYYTEKGRPFPPWLPPDPKAPQSAPAQFVTSAGRHPGQAPMGGRAGGGGLSDLWDAPSQQQPQQEPLSLRRGQGRGAGRPFQQRVGMADSYSPGPQAQGRPLPSQRAGSYQSTSSFGGRPPAEPSPPPSAGSAQERLKARLWGSGKSTSSVQSTASSNSTSSQGPPPSGGMRSPFDRSSAGQGGGRPPYPDERSSGYSAGGGGGGGGGRQQQMPYVSANSPWASGDDGYGGGGGYGGQQQQPPAGSGGRRIGLPSGPRMRS
jgi:hypothetical protein